MNKKLWTLILGVVLVALLAGAYVLYDGLSADYAAPQEEEICEVAQTVVPAENLADFAVLDAAGNTVKYSDFLGKPAVINLWASWCPPCKSELPSFDKLSAEYEGKVNFLMINLTDGSRETVEGVKAFVEKSGYSFPVYFDTEGEAATVYNVYSIPLSIFLDASGNVVTTHLGSMSEDALRGYIDNLLK